MAAVTAFAGLVKLLLHVFEVNADVPNLLGDELVASACQIWQDQPWIILAEVPEIALGGRNWVPVGLVHVRRDVQAA